MRGSLDEDKSLLGGNRRGNLLNRFYGKDEIASMSLTYRNDVL